MWCSEFKRAVKKGKIYHTTTVWFFDGMKIDYCPFCRATLSLDDF